MKITTLHWGVKESFRRYVEGSGGAVAVSGSASRAENGEIVFPAIGANDLETGAAGAWQGQAQFSGAVSFSAHGGMLNVLIVDPAIAITPAGAVLTVAEAEGAARRIEFARLDIGAATHNAEGDLIIPARLTMDGAYALGDHYPATTQIDSVRLAPQRG